MTRPVVRQLETTQWEKARVEKRLRRLQRRVMRTFGALGQLYEESGNGIAKVVVEQLDAAVRESKQP